MESCFLSVALVCLFALALPVAGSVRLGGLVLATRKTIVRTNAEKRHALLRGMVHGGIHHD